MIEEEDVERALHHLLHGAEQAAQAAANRHYLQEYRKVLKAQLMAEHLDLPVNAQEREAYRDARFLEHLKGEKEAVYEDERYQFLNEAAHATIKAWQTQSATLRVQI